MTRDQTLAVAAAAIILACSDDNLRNLSAKERAVAIRGRDGAWQILAKTGVEPTELKELGLEMMMHETK